MKKSAVFIATSMALSSSLYAADISFYGGAAIQRINFETNFNSLPWGSRLIDEDSAMALKFFGGSRWKLGEGFLGLELAYEDGQSKIEMQRFPQDNLGPTGPRLELEDNRSYSLTFTGGYKVYNNTFLIGRLGHISSVFDYKSLDGVNTVYDDNDDTLSGIQVAIGVDHYYTQNLGVRVELIKSVYPGNISPVALDSGTGEIAKFDSISRQAISIGVFSNF